MKGIDAWHIVAPIMLEYMERSTLKEFMGVYVMVYMGLERLDKEDK